MANVEFRMAGEQSDELRAALESLQKSAEAFPHLRDVLGGLLLENGERLKPGLVEIRTLPASARGGLSLALDVSERLRGIAAAAATGEADQLSVFL